MKIKKVKWKNHPVLGDLEIDFINPINGEAYSTIILAGENGTGKTSILSSLTTFLNIGSFEYFDYIEYSTDTNNFTVISPSDGTTIKTFFDIRDSATGIIHKIRSDRHNSPNTIQEDKNDLRHYGCVFSKARADYKTQQIRFATTKQLDEDKYDKDDEDDFTALKQLLVDVQNQDNSEYADLSKSLGVSPKPWNDFYLTSKTFRFKNAFDNFFESLKYLKVVDGQEEKSILFEKNGKTISIDDLSTGEKQIVFRGIYLLKNNKQLNGAIVMIDEPELSMHPKWQQNILKYYKQLFTNGNDQIAQLFLATHSEYVVGNGLKDPQESLVIVLTESAGIINARRIDAPSVLPTITSAETNYLAFDVVSNDYHVELYGWLQDKEAKNTVKSCDNFIVANALYNSTYDKPSSFGLTTYQSLCTFIRNAIHHPSPANTFTEIELKKSIELLIELCR